MPIVNNTKDLFDLLIFEKEPVEVSESLDKNEVVITDPIPEVKPKATVEVVPSTPSGNKPEVPSTKGDSFISEAIMIGLVLLVGYGVFRILFILLPLILTVGAIGAVTYLGLKII